MYGCRIKTIKLTRFTKSGEIMAADVANSINAVSG